MHRRASVLYSKSLLFLSVSRINLLQTLQESKGEKTERRRREGEEREQEREREGPQAAELQDMKERER